MGNNKERSFKQNKSVDLLEPDSEFLHELFLFKQRYLTLQNEHFMSMTGPADTELRLAQELASHRAMVTHFVELLRHYPQMPLKPTTNTGGDAALELDFQGMYEFFEVKVRNALRLNEEETLTDAAAAREQGIRILSASGGFAVLPHTVELRVTIPDEMSPDIVRNLVFAEKLALEAKSMGIPIPTLEEFWQLDEQSQSSTASAY